MIDDIYLSSIILTLYSLIADLTVMWISKKISGNFEWPYYINGQIFKGTTTPVPWMGYWLCYEGKVVPVENFAGVWFEIQKRNNIFKATRVTHHGMAFTHDPLPGVDLWAL